MVHRLDTTVRWGLVLLVLWTPLAFGAVHAWAYSLMACHVFLLLAAWMVRQLLSGGQSMDGAAVRSLPKPVIFLVGGFVIWVLFQLVPLPAPLLKTLSPATYDVYRLFLPQWPVATMTLSLHPYATRIELGKFLAYVGLFCLIVHTLRTQHHLRRVYWALVVGATVVALIGIAQNLSGTSAIYWIRDTSYADFFGPYVNRNHCAAYLGMVIPLALGLLLTTTIDADREAPATWRHRLLRCCGLLAGQRLLLVYAIAIMAGALCLALSRGGVLSLVLALTFFGLLLRSRRDTSSRRGGVLLSLAAMAIVALWFGTQPLVERFITIASDHQAATLAGRLPIFQATWGMVKDFPVFGIGYEAFPAVFPQYQPAVLQGRILQAHNDVLQLLAETGWGGLALLGGGGLCFVITTVRSWRTHCKPLGHVMVPAGFAALAAIGFHALIDFPLHIPANALACTVVLALTYVCSTLPGSRGKAKAEAQARKATGVTWLASCGHWLLLLIALWSAYGALRVGVADLLYPQQPVLRPDHWVNRAGATVQRQRLRRALRWTPHNDHYWRTLAQLDVQRVQPLMQGAEKTVKYQQDVVNTLQRAAAWYKHTLQQRPTDAATQLARLGVLHTLTILRPLLDQGRIAELTTLSARIATLTPSDPSTHYTLGVLALARIINGLAPSASSESDRKTMQQFFRHAIHLQPSYYPKVLQAYLQQLPQSQALEGFDQTVPPTPLGHLQAAQALEKTFWHRARRHYLAALALDRSHTGTLRAYAAALQRHRGFAAAAKVWERLQESHPDDAIVSMRLANTYHQLGDTAAVLRTLRLLVERFPRQLEYRDRLATTYVRLGQTAAAEAEWRTMISQQPRSVTGYVALARLYSLRQDTPAAITMLQRALALAPGTVDLHYQLARLYEKNGDVALAGREYQRLAALRPDDADVLYHLGAYWQRAGDAQRAYTYYCQAVRLEPQRPSFQRALQAIEQQRANGTSSTSFGDCPTSKTRRDTQLRRSTVA